MRLPFEATGRSASRTGAPDTGAQMLRGTGDGSEKPVDGLHVLGHKGHPGV